MSDWDPHGVTAFSRPTILATHKQHRITLAWIRCLVVKLPVTEKLDPLSPKYPEPCHPYILLAAKKLNHLQGPFHKRPGSTPRAFKTIASVPAALSGPLALPSSSGFTATRSMNERSLPKPSLVKSLSLRRQKMLMTVAVLRRLHFHYPPRVVYNVHVRMFPVQVC